ncbi:MAG TPA: hypothetical protein VKV36_09215 [Acidimicrobiales bacterium]|nr:hypothetical protein [Acidimicrobiales bacterium]
MAPEARRSWPGPGGRLCDREDAGGTPKGLVAIPTYRDAPATRPADLAGRDLAGSPVAVEVVGVDRWTLLLFLSTGCLGCQEIWRSLQHPEPFAGVTPVVVTRDPGADDGDALRRLAPSGVAVVQSTPAWRAYRVQGPPFFVLVDGGRGQVATEGVAVGASHIAEVVAAHLAVVSGGPAPPAG